MRLALFFTEGVSLKTWDEVGMLDRELALYKKLQDKGVEVEFVTYGGQDDQLLAGKIPGINLRTNSQQQPIWLYERSLRNSPPKAEIFKSNQVAGSYIASDAAKRAKVKFIARCGYLLSEFQEQKYGKASRETKDARKLEKQVFTQANAVVVTTEAMAETVRVNYGISPDKLSVIPNYVEIDRFTPRKSMPRSRMRVLFVGRLDKQKNLSAFVRAVYGLEVEIWLVGYGPQRDQLVDETKGSTASFIFLGNLPNSQLPDIMNECDIFVLPSLYEGHPKALLEAMACGMAVVGTRVSGTKEVLQNGKNGLLSDTDAGSLRGAIQVLLEDEAMRQRLGSAARAYVVKNFALAKTVDLEFDLLSRVAQG